MSSPTFFYALTSVFKMSCHTFLVLSFLFQDIFPYFPCAFVSVSKISFHTFLVPLFLFPRYLAILSLCFRFCFQDIFPYFPCAFASVFKMSSVMLSLCFRFCLHDVFFHNHPIPLSFLFSHSLLWQIVCSGIMILFLPFDFFIC